MAGNKSGKSNNPLLNAKPIEEPGKPVLYIGLLGKKFTCPTCERSLSRGIIFENLDKRYCSKRCIVQ